MKNMHLYVAIPLFVCFARIELRDAPIIIQDGLAGAAAVDESMPMVGATTFGVDAVVLNTDDTDQIPIGARFTIASESGSPIHTVTARTPSSGTTTDITFTPATVMGVADNAVLTFLPQRIEVKIGEGNLTYTETRTMEYLLDRGDLDTVKEGDQVPMEVSLEFTYEHVTTGTGEVISPVDAIKRKGSAEEWVSTSSDQCQPFSVDIVIEHNTPCGTAQDEKTVFPDFRYETLNFDLSAATISVQGKCNVTEPEVTRLTLS